MKFKKALLEWSFCYFFFAMAVSNSIRAAVCPHFPGLRGDYKRISREFFLHKQNLCFAFQKCLYWNLCFTRESFICISTFIVLGIIKYKFISVPAFLQGSTILEYLTFWVGWVPAKLLSFIPCSDKLTFSPLLSHFRRALSNQSNFLSCKANYILMLSVYDFCRCCMYIFHSRV